MAVAARPPYFLEHKKTLLHGVPRTSYTLLIREDIWQAALAPSPRFGDAASSISSAPAELAVPQQHAEQAYVNAATAHTNGEVTRVPTHVALVVLTSSVLGLARKIIVPTAIVDAAVATGKTWIYIVEGNASLCLIECVGGMPIGEFKRIGRKSVSGYTIYRPQAAVDPTGFCDSALLERESSLPPFPTSLTSSYSSIVQSSSSSSALLDYAGQTPPSEVQSLCQIVTAHVPRDHLLRERYASLQNIARFMRSSNMADGTARTRFESATIALFQDFSSTDADMQHRVDVVTHWDVRRFVMAEAAAGNHNRNLRAWFVEQEVSLVTLRLRLAHSDADDLVRLVGPVAEEFALNVEEGGCYSIGAIDALAAGVGLDARGIGALIDSTTHRILMTVEQVADKLMPLWLTRTMNGEIKQPQPVVIVDDYDGDDRTCDGVDDDDDDSLRTVAKEIIEDRQRVTKGGKAGLHLPVNNADVSSLPDLEDLGAVKTLYPPCAFLLAEKLRHDNHLKFGERLAYTSFLLDVNYPKPTVVGHLRKHFKGVSEDQFKAKYASSVNRNEKGRWIDGMRDIPYGMSCSNLIAGRNIAGDNVADKTLHLGCPLQRLDREDLTALLRRMGVPDPEHVAYLARIDKNYSGACAQSFVNKFGRAPGTTRLASWRPIAPRAYFQEAKDMLDQQLRAE